MASITGMGTFSHIPMVENVWLNKWYPNMEVGVLGLGDSEMETEGGLRQVVRWEDGGILHPQAPPTWRPMGLSSHL